METRVDQILEDLTSVQGVAGAFVFDARGALLASRMPPLFKAPRLLALGRTMAKIHSAGRTNFPDLSEGFLAFDESMLVVRSIVDKVFLVLLGEPTLNVNLATLSMNLAAEDLKDAVESRKEEDRAIPAVLAAPVLPTHSELMESGPLAGQLQGMQAALAKCLGPMAKIIFQECVEYWLKLGPPSRTGLPQLLEIVVREIADPPKAEGYRRAVAQILLAP